MLRKKKLCTFVVDRRELATILAALRFHQDENLQNRSEIPDAVIKEIASDGGSLKPLGFNDVNRLCEKINLCDEISVRRLKEDWVVIVTDRSAVVHVRAYGAKSAATKGLFTYLREYHDYDGRKNMGALAEWIEEHGKQLNVDIVQQDIRGLSD
jgi:hypothetical protein